MDRHLTPLPQYIARPYSIFTGDDLVATVTVARPSDGFLPGTLIRITMDRSETTVACSKVDICLRSVVSNVHGVTSETELTKLTLYCGYAVVMNASIMVPLPNLSSASTAPISNGEAGEEEQMMAETEGSTLHRTNSIDDVVIEYDLLFQFTLPKEVVDDSSWFWSSSKTVPSEDVLKWSLPVDVQTKS